MDLVLPVSQSSFSWPPVEKLLVCLARFITEWRKSIICAETWLDTTPTAHGWSWNKKLDPKDRLGPVLVPSVSVHAIVLTY